jgi:hypothetical protein
MPATNLKSTPAPHGAEATLSEVFAPRAADGAVTGFVLSHLKKGSPVLWIQHRLSRKEPGRPCLAGLPQSLDILHVDVSRPVDVLWAMEACAAAASVPSWARTGATRPRWISRRPNGSPCGPRQTASPHG